MLKGCANRARNSLSCKKFLDRLNKRLPVFVAYGHLNTITPYANCRNLHWLNWTTSSGGAYFVDVTRQSDKLWSSTHVSLNDMNVYRNKYNQNFVFRTRRAAEQYLMDIGAKAKLSLDVNDRFSKTFDEGDV